ncbi:FAD-binding oxidoreductase [Siminovitchia fortis]|uniref:FAD-binding oxidoreductase n=1 Tax=Siminovitchia fortis TaxID=254758 RepID=A0A451GBQ9_9BACI|nr:FAD-binding oxidoreductase [Siminovitchia fortis]RWR12473.1 FAD-binding oxidoreductase [Siminovitchia fortis]WHY83712.1 FAD-binding oxidoreductase [Siminovitchia fortis]
MSTTSILSELKAVISEDRFAAGETDHELGNGGNITVYPQSEQEIANILSYADQSGQTVSIMGAGTKRGCGGLVESTDILLSLKSYSGIVEHVPGDMTVTVKAGTRFGELQEYLSRYNQRVSIDPFTPQTSTVGGVIAANDSGPKRLGYGSARDSVIGLRVVYPNGTIIRTGGKVVKNVAGYDMNKLFIGSMGTLGVLSEITFKLRPLPKYETLVLISFPEGNMDQIRKFCIRLLDSMLEPVSLELLNPPLAEKLTERRSKTLAIAFEDVESSVLYQENYLRDLRPDGTEVRVLSEEEACDFWNKFYENPVIESLEELEASVKIGVVNLDVLHIIEETIKLENPGRLSIQAHGGMGHGLCRAVMKGEESLVADTILQLREKAREYGGYATVTHLPYKQRKQIDTWGEKPPYFFLMEGIKKTVDPNGILNPQRFLGGI